MPARQHVKSNQPSIADYVSIHFRSWRLLRENYNVIIPVYQPLHVFDSSDQAVRWGNIRNPALN